MAFDDIRVHVRLKLVALWSSLMFFYIYADYFQLWQPGHLQGMLEGRRPFAGGPWAACPTRDIEEEALASGYIRRL